MDWKLTDEEIAEISRDIVKQAKATGGGEFGLAECFGLDNQFHRAIADAAVRKALQAVDGLVIGDCMQSDNNGPFYVRVDAEGLEALKQEVGL